MNDRSTSEPQISEPRIVEFDLTAHESRRRTEVLAALGDTWDPIAVMEGEADAYRLLYSGLDAEQQATYDALVAAGVLPASGQG
ncbi:DUF6400 family protein [Streptomyces tubercidicus]|uniref:Uncharacterized protein n=1 Tax=Streptomyces tubercidicus TaxID=47759 RepID=A0A640UMV4_9ACTN|nr:DUF6400 family protein [Streptomyces tubercidicus]WAU10374.1 DUF6400 family protein [Streptomyces tubercidicus]WSK33334.1 DUF6400 family protein [Streptomyces tubercidicus]WSX24388.1 DUF6400 family protein [Streptomyces tubercidicus]GFE35466.1 hypothetical protein Stube_01390 [Streptomyces tubercidicus]